MGKIINIEKIADRLEEELMREVKKMPDLSLASLRFGQAPDAQIYVNSQMKLAKKIGVDFFLHNASDQLSEEEAVGEVKKLNQNKEVKGIIVNKPFPKEWKPEEIFSAILPQKDIEGVSPYNLGKMIYGDLTFVSPTVLAVFEIINSLKIDLYGKNVTVVGFSTLIGKPLVLLLGQRFATVSLTHIATYQKEKLPFYVKNADLLISAVGKPHFIKAEWIKDGAVVIDVGISKKESKIVGDVEFEPAVKKTAFISPVPGGVGRLTSLFLFKNLVKAGKLCN
jgi:methylenetetrahydrofolate dehydrogenase (NADP+)/methenyltetrahydrofolate cyclohydrolase